MIECERIISEGKVAPAFLKEEERCDYVISEKMKKSWVISLDILSAIIEICKKNQLTCYVGGGTLLGAIRHKGMIPWDDDIDVWMPRQDYDFLVKNSSQLFKSPLFLQNPMTDKGFYNRQFSRVRNGNSTCISNNDQKLSINNGIMVDIFPLDAYRDNVSDRLFMSFVDAISYLLWNKAHYQHLNEKSIIRKLMYVFALPLDISKTYAWIERICSKKSKSDSDKVGPMFCGDLGHYKKNRLIYNTKDFESVSWVPFEYITVPVPNGYDNILKTLFGDYMKFPPKNKRGNLHTLEFDPDIPYKEYCERKYAVKYKEDMK